MNKVVEFITAAVLIVWMVFSVHTFIVNKSLTCDEVSHHIAAGYSYVKTGDYRMNPATPSLVRTLIGLPLLSRDMRLPSDHISWQTNDSPVFGDLFLYEYNEFSHDIALYARMPVLALAVFTALLVFAWSRQLFGREAGFLALFLFTFSPSVLGNSGLAMADIGCGFFMLLSVYTLWNYIERRGVFRLLMAGMALGFAQASKHTAVILLPVAVTLLFLDAINAEKRSDRGLKNAGALFVLLITAAISLWATYSFEMKPLLRYAPDVSEKIGYIRRAALSIPLFGGEKLADKMVYFARHVPIPLSSFAISLLGVANQVLVSGQPLYFLGDKYLKGRLFYYPLLALIKIPLPLVFLTLYSSLAGVLGYRKRKDAVTEFSLWGTALLIMVSVSFSKVQGGIRYLIPAYPFVLIWVSGSVVLKGAVRKYRRVLILLFAILMIWYAAGTLRVFPHFLGYYNVLAGGPGGYAHRITHDMDWGQDLIQLRRYCEEEGVDRVVRLYFGTARPSGYGLRTRQFGEEELSRPSKEVYAVSVRYLGSVEWAKDRAPDAKAGYSIFIYDMRDEAGDEGVTPGEDKNEIS
jgi:hypothetical protein